MSAGLTGCGQPVEGATQWPTEPDYASRLAPYWDWLPTVTGAELQTTSAVSLIGLGPASLTERTEFDRVLSRSPVPEEALPELRERLRGLMLEGAVGRPRWDDPLCQVVVLRAGERAFRCAIRGESVTFSDGLAHRSLTLTGVPGAGLWEWLATTGRR